MRRTPLTTTPRRQRWTERSHHLLVDVRTSAEELRVTDGVRQVGVEQVLTKSCWRLVGHLDTVL